MIELRDMFAKMLEQDASDLHLVVGAPPQLRVRGDLGTIDGYGDLTPEDTREIVFGILTNEQRQRLEVQWELDFSYSVPGLARWRVNAFFQRGAVGAAFRIIPERIRPLSSLGVPDAVYGLCDLPRGLVLVTGPTGSGKSTTLAGMIDVINEQRHEHILTVEDPIEFIHQHKNCIVNQREVGADTDSFARALKSALRQDPDVVLVGEMRDLETIQTALTAAETGHLVFGTLHTNGAAKTIDRVIDVFPPHQQAQVRVQLASSLQGVVTQTLIPTRDGSGRAVACEVMIPNGAIRNLIREGKVFQIPSVMQTSQAEGMQTLDAALATLVRTNAISMEEALKRCAETEEFERLVASGAGAPTPGGYTYQTPAVVRLQRRYPGAGGAAAAAPATHPAAPVPSAPVPVAPVLVMAPAGVVPGAPAMSMPGGMAPAMPVPAQHTPIAAPVAPSAVPTMPFVPPGPVDPTLGMSAGGGAPSHAAPPMTHAMPLAPMMPPAPTMSAGPPMPAPAGLPGMPPPHQVGAVPAQAQPWAIDPATGQPVVPPSHPGT